MKCQAEILLLKTKLRLMKGTLRHAWQPLLGFLIVGVALAYQLIFVVAKAGRGTAVSSQGILYVLLAVVTINLFRVFLNQTPVFRMEAASVMLTYNTKQFYKVLCRKQGLSVLLSTFVAGVLSFILSGFLLDAAFGKLFGLLALYFCNCSFLSWIFYHLQGKAKWLSLPIFAVCSVLLILRSFLSIALLAASLCALWLYAQRVLRLNLPKYFERLQFLEMSATALSHNDYVKMRQMAEENRPSYVSAPMLHHWKPTKRTALWMKSLLEILRMQKRILILLALLLFAGWLVWRTDLLTFVPLLENPSITKGIAGFCAATVFSTLHQLLIQQVKAVSDKRLLGLSLPFTTKQIILSYGVNAAAINLLLTLAVGFLYSAFSPRLLLLWGVENIAYFAVCCASVYDIKIKRGISAAANVLLFASAYYCLMV